MSLFEHNINGLDAIAQNYLNINLNQSLENILSAKDYRWF